MADEQPLAIGFGDLRGFTTYTAEHGDRMALRVAERFAAMARDELAERGGRLVKTYGDGVMVSFPEASAAVESAIGVQKSLAAYNETHPEDALCAGFGLTWGPAIRTGDDLFGNSVNLAKRLADLAKGCQIVVSPEVRARAADATAYSYRELGEKKIKGIGPTRLFEVVWRDEAAFLSLPDDSLDVVLTNDQRLVLEFAKPVEAALEAVRAKLADSASRGGPAAFLQRKMAERLVHDLPKWVQATRRYGGAGLSVVHRLDQIDAEVVDGELRIRLPDGRQLEFARGQIREEDAARFLSKLLSLKRAAAPSRPSRADLGPRGERPLPPPPDPDERTGCEDPN